MSRLQFSKVIQKRWFSAKQKMKVIDAVDNQLVNNELKHRKHPGVVRPTFVKYPSWLLNRIKTTVQDEKVQPLTLCQSGEKLALHLHGRHVPVEGVEMQMKLEKVLAIRKKKNPEHEINMKNLIADPKTKILIKENIYNWSPVQYDKMTSLSYLVGRSAQEYAVLYRILNEIKTTDANFKPQTLFDFGSGIGSVMWAASELWSDSLKEYVCVDISQNMIDLSEDLIKHAKPEIDMKKIFYRQYLSATPTPTYDIVVNAYSLFELPSLKSRVELLSNLWKKTQNYLILVEQGTNAGFRLIVEARDYILNYPKKQSDHQSAHIFSPCPHDLTCPRYVADNTPCNFEVLYETLPLAGPSQIKKEHYCYVVLKKGNRSKDDDQWPRIVRTTLKRSKHVICRMCTASGKLEEQIFTAWKNGKNTYRCARTSKWGDRLPFTLEKVEEENAAKE